MSGLSLDRTPFERAARSRPKNSQALRTPRSRSGPASAYRGSAGVPSTCSQTTGASAGTRTARPVCRPSSMHPLTRRHHDQPLERPAVAKGVLILRPYVQEALLFGAQHGVLSMQGRHVDGDRAAARKIARYLRQSSADVRDCAGQAGSRAFGAKPVTLGRPLSTRVSTTTRSCRSSWCAAAIRCGFYRAGWRRSMPCSPCRPRPSRPS